MAKKKEEPKPETVKQNTTPYHPGVNYSGPWSPRFPGELKASGDDPGLNVKVLPHITPPPTQTIRPEGIPSGNGAGRFRRLPVEVEAERVILPTKVETPKGVLWAKRGEWVITGPDGVKSICKDEEFRRNYVPVLFDPYPPVGAKEEQG